MITREELAILQRQLVEMNDERVDMLTHIQTLTHANQQVSIIRQTISDLRAQAARDEKKLTDEMEKVRTKLQSLTEEQNQPRSTTWDEKRMAKREANLQQLLSTNLALDATLLDLCNRDSLLESRGNEIMSQLGERERSIQYFTDISKRIGSFAALSMTIKERESRLSNLSRTRIRISTRIQNLRENIVRVSESTDQFRQNLTAIEESLKTLQNGPNLDASLFTEELYQHRGQLGALRARLLLLQESNTTESLRSSEIVSQETAQTDALNQVLSQANDEIRKLQITVSHYQVEHDIVLNKKSSLIAELQKSIKERVNEIVRSRNDSIYVQRLIAAQEKHLVEKQALMDEYDAVAARHHQTTQMVARKSRILVEMGTFLKTAPPGKDPLSALNACYQMARESNRLLADNLVRLQKELEITELENLEVKRRIAHE
jgi:hypothetical protein